MELNLVWALLIFIGASGVLATKTPFAFKKTPAIILLAATFTASYAATAFLFWLAGYSIIGIIAFVAGIAQLARRMFKDAMRF